VENLILYSSCTILGGAGAAFISRFAFRFDLMDIPNERSSHEISVPIPKGGGLGILGAFVGSSLVLKISASFWLPAAGLSLISFYGDKFPISPKFRLSIQFVAALLFLLPFVLVDFSGNFYFLPILCLVPLSIFIVGTSNFYNFMDGINGIAGITGIVGFGLLTFYLYFSGLDSSYLSLAICMSLACLGFLPFNLPKAKVFMGDVGSILLGFVFAGIIIWISKSLLDFICLSAFLFPFYADEITTMIVRLRNGEKLWIPHRRHLYQLLANEYAVPHWKISLGYGLGQLLVGLSVLYFMNAGLPVVLSIILLYFLIFTVIQSVVRKRLV